MKIIIVVILIFHSSFGAKMYTNYTLFRSVPTTEEHLNFLRELPSLMKVDYWMPPGRINKPVDILINPDDKQLFLRSMEERNVNYTSVIDDVQRIFDLQTVQPYVRRKMETFNWASFFTLKDIYAWMKDLEQTYTNQATILHLGKTYENREILALKVILRGCKRRSAVIVEGGIHAREWIAPAFVTYFMNQILLSSKNPNSAIGKIALLYEFYFVPVLNPDGYEYSMVKDRMWRKNRFGGYGIDINRNFDVAFGTTGVSNSKYSETYCGERAFSERESQAMEKLVRIVKDKLEYYLAFHSYGQFIIIPYAHSKNHVANYDEVHNILKKASNDIARKFNTKYTVGTAFDTVGYTTSGVSGCWVKKAHKVPYVAMFELRDRGKYGFALPHDLILPACEETLDGMLTILQPNTDEFRKLSDSKMLLEQEEISYGSNVLRQGYQKDDNFHETNGSNKQVGNIFNGGFGLVTVLFMILSI